MIITHQLIIEGTVCTVVISDETEALLAAKAAGSAIVGLWHPGSAQELGMADYLVERPEDAEPRFLEKVIRRSKGWPLIIAVTERLVIREFREVDYLNVYQEEKETEADRIFRQYDSLKAYIQSQYGFYEYGLWALTEKDSGQIVGKAGITGVLTSDWGLELGYHIFTPYRRQGYAAEACRAVIDYTLAEFAPSYLGIKTDASNEASVRLAIKLGFKEAGCSEAGLRQFHLARCY